MATNIPTMRVIALLGVLTAVSCADRAAKRASSSASRNADSAIYAAVIDSLRLGSRSVRVARQYEPLPDAGPGIAGIGAWAAAQRDHLDSGLVVALAREQHAGSVAATAGHLLGVRWIDRDSVRVEASRHDENTPIVQLSRVAYSSDSSRAVVYGEMWCGRLCGNGAFYQFQRSSAGTWLLTGRAVRFVS